MYFNFYANILESKEPVVGDDYFLQTKEEIIEWLKKYGIENYKINDDLTVDVNKTVVLQSEKLTKIDIKFNKIIGYFDISQNNLISLKGSPSIITSDFYCDFNDLTSLKYSPVEVGGNFNCEYNKLTSLEGCPEIINGYFNCNDNLLKTLKGHPKIIRGIFECKSNKLTSLKYFPIIEFYPFISNNPIKKIKGLKNISTSLLTALIMDYEWLDWKEIEWNNVKNLDEIVTELYENIKYGINIEASKKVLKKMEEIGAY